MAANISSTLHYAAGIPVAGCQQLRKNLVTKTLKTTTIASNNPAMPSETSSLVSMPRQLQRNSVCYRRDKTVVAAYPDLKIEVKTIITPGVPEYTAIEIQNHSHKTLKIDDKYFWAGSQYPDTPKEIKGWHIGRFEHKADSDGSIGAVEYVFPGDEYKLILAWSNARDDLNKVYTEILREDANWNHIKEKLNIAGQKSIFHDEQHRIPYSSWVEIDKTSPTPKMWVTVAHGLLAEPNKTLSNEISKLPTVGGEQSIGDVNGAQLVAKETEISPAPAGASVGA